VSGEGAGNYADRGDWRNAAHAVRLLDDTDDPASVYEVDVAVLDEARALLDGEGAPADTEEQQ
jgi:hypothetical protein